ncbi:MAG: hypothetical protein HC904_17180 [Blastochloris sp.]|nr:hypothetical protein [Blastochloris sp.]
MPHSLALTFPLWLATRDEAVLEEMIWLQLERRGLLAGSRLDTVMSHRVLRHEEERVLVSVSVLTTDYPETLSFPRVSRYGLSSELIPWPENHLCFWKELGHEVFAFSSGQHPIYVRSSPGEELSETLIQEAFCARLQLECDQVLAPGSLVTVWDPRSRAEQEILIRQFGANVRFEERPAPRLPATPALMLPLSVRRTQESQKQNQQRNRIMTGLGLLYLVALLSFLGHLGWLHWQKRNLETELARHRSEVETIRNTAARWEAMELALLPELYPLEMLYRCTRPLPEEGIRLVTFDQSGSRVLMTGEAKNSAMAFKFLQDLKDREDLASYRWEMPPPKLLPTDAAQFQIEGRYSYASEPQ